MYMKDDVKTSNELFLFPALSPRKFSLGDDDLLQTARAKGTVYVCVCVCVCVGGWVYNTYVRRCKLT